MEMLLPEDSGMYALAFKNRTSLDEDELLRVFSKYGEVKSLRIDPRSFYVFIRYSEYREAKFCLEDTKTKGYEVFVARSKKTNFPSSNPTHIDDSAKPMHSDKREHLDETIGLPTYKYSDENATRPKPLVNHQAALHDIAEADQPESAETHSDMVHVIVANLPYTLLRKDFIKLIQAYNPASVSKMECSGIRYNIIFNQVSFMSKSDADRIIMELDGKILQGHRLIVNTEEEFLATLEP